MMATDVMPKMAELMKVVGVDSSHKHFGRALKAWYEAHRAWVDGGKTGRLDTVRQEKLAMLQIEAEYLGLKAATAVEKVLDRYGY